MAKMTDADLKELVAKRRDASVKHLTDLHASDRREALQFYRGDNSTIYGDSGNGLSTVVSRDTLEAVESMLPGLIKPFVAGDEAVRFEPTQEADEQSAKQATEYVNNRFANDNSAFRVVYDFAKDGLMFRLGVAKVVYEEVDETDIDTFSGLSQEQYDALDAQVREDDGLEIVGEPTQEIDGSITVKVKRQQARGTYRVHVIAPDEFLYEDRLACLEDAQFLGHRPNGGRAVGDLIAMGLDKKKCMELQGLEPESLEEQERYGWEEMAEQYDDDDLARKVTVGDYYIRCDYEGTGVLGWRRVVLAGGDDTVLLNEPVEDHPFVAWTPIPIPHKLVGMSIHDLVRDIQMQKTALVRETMNASYLANRPMREIVDGQVNIDDLLNPSVGGFVRVKQANSIREIQSGGEGVMEQSAAMIEYLDTVREQRTGSTRYNQGMDANSLNKTATGISIIQNASTQRLEMISRQLAEAMMQIFRKMLGLITRYATQPDVVRVSGQWVKMDPREWRTGYDMSVAVGLGTGNKDQMAAHLTNLMNIQKEIAAGQGGMAGPLVTWQNVYEAGKRLVENLGLKGAELYLTDPSTQNGAPPQPQEGPPQVDPLAELQAKGEVELKKAVIAAEAEKEVARINAEKEIIIAGLQVPPNITPRDDAVEPQETPSEPPQPHVHMGASDLGQGDFGPIPAPIQPPAQPEAALA